MTSRPAYFDEEELDIDLVNDMNDDLMNLLSLLISADLVFTNDAIYLALVVPQGVSADYSLDSSDESDEDFSFDSCEETEESKVSDEDGEVLAKADKAAAEKFSETNKAILDEVVKLSEEKKSKFQSSIDNILLAKADKIAAEKAKETNAPVLAEVVKQSEDKKNKFQSSIDNILLAKADKIAAEKSSETNKRLLSDLTSKSSSALFAQTAQKAKSAPNTPALEDKHQSQRRHSMVLRSSARA